MKKIIYAFGLIMAIVLSSCSNDDSNIVVSTGQFNTPEGISVLVEDLTNLNDSLIATHAIESRGFVHKLFRWMSIASADALGMYEGGKMGGVVGAGLGPHGAAIGASIGGIICSAGASYQAYCGTRADSIVPLASVVAAYVQVIEDSINIMEFYPSRIKLNLPKDKAKLLTKGANHNLVLANIRDKRFSMTPASNVLVPMEIAILSSSEFEKEYNSFFHSCDLSIVEQYQASEASVSDQVMSLYLDAMKKFVEADSDMELLSNQYVERIAVSSELPDEEKDILISAICVAVSSCEYWHDEFKAE